jgi:magnesium transporter
VAPDDPKDSEVPAHKTVPGFPAMGREPVANMEAAPDDSVDDDQDAFLSSELEEVWAFLSIEERVEGFRILSRSDAEELFDRLSASDQARLILALPQAERRSWMRYLEPDDAADVVQSAQPEEKDVLLNLLDEATRKEVGALLAYAEDAAGGLMNPRYVRVRPGMTVDEAMSYLRKQARERVETIHYSYVLDAGQKLLGVVSFRDLFAAQPGKTVAEVMKTDLVTATEETDQEALSQLFGQHGLMAIPVLDGAGQMKGVVTVDDIVDVVQEEATEDIQKMGAVAALEAPYLNVGFLEMLKKRAGWLAVLFVGEMFTATALAYFQKEIDKATVLAMFMPLIISAGGNSGSQATTLVIRAIALGEVRLRDWWRVAARELLMGATLGGLLGLIGLTRILLWPSRVALYGEHFALVGLAVALSVVGVVLFGTMAGAMLPMVLRKLGLDPASASAPAVATIVDVTGLVIYFTVASIVLTGTLL